MRQHAGRRELHADGVGGRGSRWRRVEGQKSSGQILWKKKWQLTRASVDGQRQEENSLPEGCGSRREHRGAFGEHQSVGGSVIIGADKR